MLKEVDIYRGYLQDIESPELLATMPVTKKGAGATYRIVNIDGLGPVSADLTMSTYAGWDGGLMQNAKTGSRNLVLSILYPKGGDDTHREALYEIFPPKSKVELRFKIGSPERVMRIFAWVESHEPILFSANPSVQVSLLCPEPYFSSMEEVVVPGFALSEFVIGGDLGSAESEFEMILYPNRDITWLTIDNYQQPQFVWRGKAYDGDTLVISMIKGEKKITVNDEPALDGLSSGALDLSISRSKNRLNVQTSGFTKFAAQIRYLPKSLGI